jgi:threonine/homoserine/homoserine lactone efflux protein
MTVEAWALFCVTETILCINPGPSTLVVISQSVTRGASAGVRAAVGVLAANAIYFGLSAAGLVALHSLSAEAFSILKWGGSAYLLWLGVSAISRSFRSAPPPGPVEPGGTGATGRPFLRGFVAQGANPNLLVYFTAILPQFIDSDLPLAPQVFLLACSSFVIEFAVLSAYSVLSGRAGAAAAPRFRAYLERLGGALLIGAAAGLARIERG